MNTSIAFINYEYKMYFSHDRITIRLTYKLNGCKTKINFLCMSRKFCCLQ